MVTGGGEQEDRERRRSGTGPAPPCWASPTGATPLSQSQRQPSAAQHHTGKAEPAASRLSAAVSMPPAHHQQHHQRPARRAESPAASARVTPTGVLRSSCIIGGPPAGGDRARRGRGSGWTVSTYRWVAGSIRRSTGPG